MHTLTCESVLPLPPDRVYVAWTSGWALWFACADTVAVTPREGAPFFFEVAAPSPEGPVRRHPHYGRFLELVPDERVRCTWVTGSEGTGGIETQLTIVLTRTPDGGTRCTLTHEGFGSEASRDRHAAAWPHVLETQRDRLSHVSAAEWDRVARPVTAVRNRSLPEATFIPTRSYPDLDAAVDWLVTVLGCRERLRVPGERAQLTLGNGAVIVAAWDPAAAPATGGRPPATLVVRVHDIDAAWARALQHGATGLVPPATRTDGERQATVRDPSGHAWTLTQSVADVAPEAWGAVIGS